MNIHTVFASGRFGRLMVLAGVSVTLICASVAASAQEMSDAEAVEAYKKVEVQAALLTREKPRLLDVRLAIAADCHAKAGSEATAYFCYCAGALTVTLWYGNQAMSNRLKLFTDKTNGTPQDLLQYQGPELYVPFCRKVVAGMAAATH